MFPYDRRKYFQWDENLRRLRPAWWRADIKPVWLYYDTNLNANPKAVAAAGAPTPDGVFKQFYGGGMNDPEGLGMPMLIDRAVFADSTDTTAAANWTIKLRDGGHSRDFMATPIHIRTFAGTAALPCYFREPFFMESQNALFCQLAKVAGGAVNTRLYLAGKQFYPYSPDLRAMPGEQAYFASQVKKLRERAKYIMPYWQTPDVNPIVLAAGTAGVFYVKIAEDSQFEALALIAVSGSDFSLEITEAKTGQSLMNSIVTRNTAIGGNLFPTILPASYLLPGGYTLVVRIQNLNVGAPDTIWLTMAGRKIFAPLANVREVLQDTRPDEVFETVDKDQLTPYG